MLLNFSDPYYDVYSNKNGLINNFSLITLFTQKLEYLIKAYLKQTTIVIIR